jgi:hypothetical protein
MSNSLHGAHKGGHNERATNMIRANVSRHCVRRSLGSHHKLRVNTRLLVPVVLLVQISSCHRNTEMDDKAFIAERLSKSATITLNGPIEEVFPLFGVIEEKKWADGWNPVVLYPISEKLEEGMVFTTQVQSHSETTYAWIVSKYQPENNLVEYIVSTANRYWMITIHCVASSDTETKATVRYTFTGLTALGNEINKHAIEKMYERNLEDWEEAINHYLKTGKALKHH